MTFYNIFQNLNMNYFSGFNNWFNPSFGMFDQFSMPFFNWNMPSLFSFNAFQPFNFSNFFSNNNIWNSPSVFNFNNTGTSPTIDFTNYSWGSAYRYPDSTKSNNKKNNNASATSYSRSVSGNINHSYLNLSKTAAFQKAKNDPNLENLSNGGRRWSISEASFRTDIPFAKKGTGKILDQVASMIGCNLVVTSALGTGQAGNPHQRGGYTSHHNAENPKLDLRIPSGMSSEQFAQKLQSTGYFSHIFPEKDHIDVQIDPAKYSSLSVVA